ncbi:hypothetical protein [Streptomyces tremellae]|uniref:hypothetical protein n=1 Tax=Streptomyces tremellae TaxID=1124239 RepID=UPI003CD0733A
MLRSFVSPSSLEHAEDWLNREAAAPALPAGTDVPAPALVAVDPTTAHCAYPSLLMTRLAASTELTAWVVEERLDACVTALMATPG